MEKSASFHYKNTTALFTFSIPLVFDSLFNLNNRMPGVYTGKAGLSAHVFHSQIRTSQK